MGKITHDEFIQRLIEKNPKYLESYEIVSKYLSNKELITLKHKKCGTLFTSIPMRVMKGQGCPVCNPRRTKDTNYFSNEVSKSTNNEYSLISEYINCKSKVKIRHNLCNNEFYMTPDDFSQGQRCPRCSRINTGFSLRRKHEDFVSKINELTGTEYSVLSEYTTNKEYIKFKHNTCGHEFLMTPVNFYRNHRCPKCFGTPKKSTKEISNTIKLITNNEYELISEYKGVGEKITIKHKTCGRSFETLPNNFIKKSHRCPFCAFKNSKKEKELLEFITQIYNGEIKNNVKFYCDDNNKRKYYEADILIKDKKLIIEFDGLYWHSDKGKRDLNYHLEKTKYFDSLGFRTIHIFEDIWDKLKDETKKSIKTLFNNEKTYIDFNGSIGIITENNFMEFINKNNSPEIIVDLRVAPFNSKFYENFGYEIIKFINPVEHIFIGLDEVSETAKNSVSVYDCGYYVIKRKI